VNTNFSVKDKMLTWLAIIDLVRITDDRYIITRINVPEFKRGRGIGSILLKRAICRADEEGVTLELVVMSSNIDFQDEALVAWYERYGFVKELVGDEELMVRRPKVDDVVRELSLSQTVGG